MQPLIVVGDGWAAWMVVQAAASRFTEVTWIRHTTHLLGSVPVDPYRFTRILRRGTRRPIPPAREAGPSDWFDDPQAHDRWALELWQQARQPAAPGASGVEALPANVEVRVGVPRFAGRDRLRVDGQTLRFQRAILALEPAAAVPDVDGLTDCGYRTPQTLAELLHPPRCLAVLGDGATACGWAQLLTRLGAEVHLLVAGATILPGVDPEAAALIHAQLERERVRIHLRSRQTAVEPMGRRRAIVLGEGTGREKVLVDEILVCPTPRWELEGLDFPAGRIHTRHGRPRVGPHLATSNSRVFVVGGLTGIETCDAECDAALAQAAVANARQPIAWPGLYRRLDPHWAPWVVWTDPQLVHLGLPAEQIQAQREALLLEGEAHLEEGPAGAGGGWQLLKMAVWRQSGELAGVTAVAGDPSPWIVPLTLLVARRLPLSALSEVVGWGPAHLDVLQRIAARVQCTLPTRWERFCDRLQTAAAQLRNWLGGK